MREITVKGRKQPVMTYEVLGLKGEPPLEHTESAKMARVATPLRRRHRAAPPARCRRFASSSSRVFGQSPCMRRESERSARSLPPVWQRAQ